MKIFVCRQSISVKWRELISAVLRISFKSKWGKDVIFWEKKFAQFIKVPYAISFISGRAGMYFTLKTLKEINSWINPEVICPAYTFFSNPWMARLSGWDVRIADVLEKDLTLDPASLQRQINERTKAVIVTHLNGRPAKISEISDICKRANLRLLEDCAHLIGFDVDHKPVGSWDIGVFSFGDGKNLDTFGGGMVTTSDAKLAQALSRLVSGFPEQPRMRIAKEIFTTFLLKLFTSGVFYPLFLYPLLCCGFFRADKRRKYFLKFVKSTKEEGFAFRFSGLQALLGLSQLGGLEKRNEDRRANSRALRKNLSPNSLKRMFPWDGREPHAMLHDVIVLDVGLKISDESLKKGIDLRLDYCGNCRNFPGMESFGGEDKIGKSMDGKIFFIPNHMGMNPALSGEMGLALDRFFLDSELEDKSGFFIRRAVNKDAYRLANIISASFDPQDNQRILGGNINTAIFKLLFNSDDDLFLVAADEKDTLGYIWLQLRAHSPVKYFCVAPLKTAGVILAIIKEFKLKKAVELLKKENRADFPYPKIISLAVERCARRKGIASALISMSEGCISADGVDSTYVLTSSVNYGAVACYKKNGFKIYKNNDDSLILCKKIHQDFMASREG